jgi:hypothetical protein
VNLDWDGLIVAFESRSAQITHFFDRETGDVVQCVKERDPKRHEELSSSKRYIALPKDKGERSIGDMEMFLGVVDEEKLRGKLAAALSAEDPPLAFREALESDPREEARFFQFKHRRARERAQEWLASMDIPFTKPPEPVKAPRDFPGGAPGGPKPRL